MDLITFGLFIQLLCCVIALLVYLTWPGSSRAKLISSLKKSLEVVVEKLATLIAVLVMLLLLSYWIYERHAQKQKFCLEHSTDQLTSHISYTELDACMEHQSIWR